MCPFCSMRCNTDRVIWRRDRPMEREKERVRVDLSKLSSILNKLVDISDWRTIHYFHMNWFNFNKGLPFSRFIRHICTSACQLHLHICIFFVSMCVSEIPLALGEQTNETGIVHFKRAQSHRCCHSQWICSAFNWHKYIKQRMMNIEHIIRKRTNEEIESK